MANDGLRKDVLKALEHYYELEKLRNSPLTELKASQPAAGTTQSVLASEAKGLAVRDLLDRALEKLESLSPDGAKLLHQWFRLLKPWPEMAEEFNLVRQALYRRRKEAISMLTTCLADIEREASHTERGRRLQQLAALPSKYRGQELMGFEPYLEHMRKLLHQGMARRGIWVVTGLGGIGKTSLTCEALERWITEEQPPIERLLWAEIENEFVDPMERSDLALERLFWQLGDQLELPMAALPNNKQRLQVLKDQIWTSPRPSPLVIDNVETPAEIELALTIAEPLSSLAPVVITSRRDIQHNQVRERLYLRELAKADALALLEREAQRHGISALSALSNEDAQQLYDEIGGHPLALKLVAGLVGTLPVDQILLALHHHTHLADELYTHVYETSWHLLSELSQEILLLLMSLPASGCYWEGLRRFTPMYDDFALQRAITELKTFNLLQVSRKNPDGLIYFLHRLTYCFLEHKIGLA